MPKTKKFNEIEQSIIFRTRLESLMSGRNSKGITVSVSELSKAIGLTRQSILNYLNIGKGTGDEGYIVPSIAVLSRIADFFEVTPNYLLGYEAISQNDFESYGLRKVLYDTGIDYKTYQKLCELKEIKGANEEYINIIKAINGSIMGIILANTK